MANDDRDPGGQEVPTVDWEPDVPAVDWEPDVPTEPEDFGIGTSDADVDPETFRAFWGAVLAVDVGMLCVVVGPALAYARGQAYLGGLVFLTGLVAFYRAYAAYRGYVNEEPDGASDDEGARP